MCVESCIIADGIILGASCIEHISSNMSSCEEGPLGDRKSKIETILFNINLFIFPVGVVRAFDEAWELDRRYSVNYFR